MENTISELQLSNNPSLARLNKARQMEYRNYTKMIKEIYDLAKTILDITLGEGYTLPIDIKNVAEKLGFKISTDTEDFFKIEKEYIDAGHDCLPIAQLTMRKKLFGKNADNICGTIHIANYLSDFSIRFSIAHQLGLFVFREQSKIGSYLKLEAHLGFYPLTNTNEMVANIFAYALLLPYHLFEETRKTYEKDRTHWPLDYSRWISYIRDEAGIPEYSAVLACQEIKKVNIRLKYETAEKRLYEKLCALSIISAEEQQAALKLYAITVNNLEAWGYSRKDIATLLFDENNEPDGQSQEITRSNMDIIEFLSDYYINNEKALNTRTEYPSTLKEQVINRLKEGTEISPNGISQITGIPIDNISQKILSMNQVQEGKN